MVARTLAEPGASGVGRVGIQQTSCPQLGMAATTQSLQRLEPGTETPRARLRHWLARLGMWRGRVQRIVWEEPGWVCKGPEKEKKLPSSSRRVLEPSALTHTGQLRGNGSFCNSTPGGRGSPRNLALWERPGVCSRLCPPSSLDLFPFLLPNRLCSW